MAIKFVNTDKDFKRIQLKPDEDERQRSKKAAELRQAIMASVNKQAGVGMPMTKSKGTSGILSSFLTAIAAYQKRVEDDGGTFEARNCVLQASYQLWLIKT